MLLLSYIVILYTNIILSIVAYRPVVYQISNRVYDVRCFHDFIAIHTHLEAVNTFVRNKSLQIRHNIIIGTNYYNYNMEALEFKRSANLKFTYLFKSPILRLPYFARSYDDIVFRMLKQYPSFTEPQALEPLALLIIHVSNMQVVRIE